MDWQQQEIKPVVSESACIIIIMVIRQYSPLAVDAATLLIWSEIYKILTPFDEFLINSNCMSTQWGLF